jgi:hypothetical protein
MQQDPNNPGALGYNEGPQGNANPGGEGGQ